MKTLVFASALLMAGTALASDLMPGQIPDGKYDFVCSYYRIGQREGQPVQRTKEKSVGTTIVTSMEDRYFMRDRGTTVGSKGEADTTYDGLTEVKVKMLAKDHYALETKSTYSSVYEENGEKMDYRDSDTYKQVVRVQDGVMINLINEHTRHGVYKGKAETTMTDLPDGSIMVSVLLREPISFKKVEIDENVYSPARTDLASSHTCIYKPSK